MFETKIFRSQVQQHWRATHRGFCTPRLADVRKGLRPAQSVVNSVSAGSRDFGSLALKSASLR